MKKTIKTEVAEKKPVLAKKTVSAKPESSPKGTGNRKPKRLPFRRFFNAVRDDVEVCIEAVAYYDEVVEDGARHISAHGNLETLVAETPGLAYFYRGVRTDAQQIRRWMDQYIDSEKATKYKWFHSDPESIKLHGKFKTGTEITKYVEADETIQYLQDLSRVMAECEHRLEDLMEGFEERRLMLTRIIDIRRDGLKEVWIDQEAGDDNT